ncbi:MAG: hypothetical protein WBN75_07605 [Verrucomicrobiia bacterium]|jgi:hypothetical protein
MSEERHEKLTIEEIKQRLRTGCTFYPTQPGLQQAARELIRPIVEKMDGQEIIYVCRVAKLMRVKYLETDDVKFRAVAIPVHGLGDRILTIAECAALEKSLKKIHTKEEWQAAKNALPLDTTPFQFGARWDFLRLIGTAIKMNMITDSFYPDPAVVAEVKAAVARNALGEISAILDRASSKR